MERYFISNQLSELLEIDESKLYLYSEILFAFMDYLRKNKLYTRASNQFRTNYQLAHLLNIEPNKEVPFYVHQEIRNHIRNA
jgi:hypothetical protein